MFTDAPAYTVHTAYGKILGRGITLESLMTLERGIAVENWMPWTEE